MKNRRIVIDIIVVAMLIMASVVGCMNGAQTAAETTASIPESSVSDVSETEVTTTTEKETTATTTVDLFAPDPTYEEAAAHVRDLLAEGNSAEQVIAILMDEGRTEFDATALVNSVLMEDEGTNSGGSNTSSGSSGSNTDSGNSDTGSPQDSGTSGSGTSTQQTTTPTSGGSTTQTQEPTTTTTQTNGSGNTTLTSETTTKATDTVPETTPIPTKVKQTVYMKIIWSVDTRETAEAMGVDLNAERPEAVGIAILACDASGNYSVASTIDRSDFDAAEAQLYAEADAILAKYGITDGCYSYTAYKYEIEYLYD